MTISLPTLRLALLGLGLGLIVSMIPAATARADVPRDEPGGAPGDVVDRVLAPMSLGDASAHVMASVAPRRTFERAPYTELPGTFRRLFTGGASRLDMNHDNAPELIAMPGVDVWSSLFDLWTTPAQGAPVLVGRVDPWIDGDSSEASFRPADVAMLDGNAQLLYYGRSLNDFSVRVKSASSARDYPSTLAWQTPYGWWPVGARFFTDLGQKDLSGLVVAGQDGERFGVQVFERAMASGASSLFVKKSEALLADMTASQSMSMLADLDRDGRQEIAFGGWHGDDARLSIFELGRDRSLELVAKLSLVSEQHPFNASTVISVGDSNGNGRPEILVGGFRTVTSLTDAYAAAFQLMEVGAGDRYEVIAEFVLPTHLGARPCAAAGDVDGDGRPDLVMAAGDRVEIRGFGVDGRLKLIDTIAAPSVEDVAIGGVARFAGDVYVLSGDHVRAYRFR